MKLHVSKEQCAREEMKRKYTHKRRTLPKSEGLLAHIHSCLYIYSDKENEFGLCN